MTVIAKGRSDDALAEWFQRLFLLGCAAALVIPMGEGDPEHGFFFVAGFCADYWFVQSAVGLYENRRNPRVLLRPLPVLKVALIIAIVVGAVLRGRLSEVVAISLAAGFFFGLLALGAALVFTVKRVLDERAERKRH
jgi:hypothetical protein